MYQPPREPEEDASFSRALSNIGLLCEACQDSNGSGIGSVSRMTDTLVAHHLRFSGIYCRWPCWHHGLQDDGHTWWER